VVGHPVRGDVVDGVAGCAAVAEQLHLGLGVGADGGDVLVAVAIDLGGAHHHVPTAVPHPAEHLSVGVEVLDDRAARPLEGFVVGDEAGLAVGHGQVGLKGGPGEPATDHRDGADRVGQDLAIAAEALRDRDCAHISAVNELIELTAHAAPPSARSLAW